jgi:diguanylate cyclase (GGDEF)-like protein
VTKPTILIVEDELHLREVLRFQLEAAGFQVVMAENGQEGFERATRDLPDLVLMDVMMPICDGYEALRRMRGSFATKNIPIILLTAKTESGDKVSGLEVGANDYVTKPWDHKELMLRLRNVLEWSRQQRSASPLTGLPGNVSINEAIHVRLNSGQPFALLQIDIDYFKAFNDYYGYARGDDAIRRVADILIECSHRNGGADNFVGHIGGDDFVILTDPAHAPALGRDILTEFDRVVRTLYDEEDLSRGYVEVRNRRHSVERFPIMSLTIALVSTDRYPVDHLAQLIDVAQELKAHGKGMPGSVLVNERRRTAEAGNDADRSVA